uniref:Secreted RxLR effector protein 131 n=1 Tax=Plasmopara viticola TaxID=143451 RepID=RL131_PLAVT|nr:RecName: Full=Secreted RxLR effector protein 131; Flags: Precursor [Plasmopara viticola]
MRQIPLVVVLLLAYAARLQGLISVTNAAVGAKPGPHAGRDLDGSTTSMSVNVDDEERGLSDMLKRLRSMLFDANSATKGQALKKDAKSTKSVKAAGAASNAKKVGQLRHMWNQIKNVEYKGNVKYLAIIYVICILSVLGILGTVFAINRNISNQYIHE